jgi:CHAT domain-containing protein
MRDLARIHQLARHLVRQNAKPKRAPKKFDLDTVVCTENLRDIPSSLWEELNSHLDHNPALGLALARVLYTIAKHKRKRHLRATADLALIRALNICGEFYQATQLCADAARRFEKLGDAENVARVWLEAAWAETYLGNLDATENFLEHASKNFPLLTQKELKTRADWIRARNLRQRGSYQDALELFARVRAFYLKRRAKHDAMHVLREIGNTRARMNPSVALQPLRMARAFFVKTNCPLEIGLCDYYLAQALMDLNRFGKSEWHLRQAQIIFRTQQALFFEGYCDIDFGYLCWLRDEPDRMFEFSQHGHTIFTQLHAVQESATCEINVGVALMELNRYDEAVPYFQNAFHDAQHSGRQIKAANCLLNLAHIFDVQGEYAQALQQLQRARDIFRNASRTDFLITCDLRLANVYLHLNDLEQANAHIESAHHFAEQEKMNTRLAQCELYRAQLFLLRGQTRKAAVALRRARTHFARNHQRSHVALCERLLAEIPSPRRSTVRTRLSASRAIFQQQRQFVDAALCDLARAELELRWHNWKQANKFLRRAQRILQNAFPEQHARILYAWGRLAQARKQPQRTLQYFVQAAQTFARVRRTLGVEALSNSFSITRLQVVHDGLNLARRVHAPEDALTLIETAKAQTFSQQLAVQAWRLPQADARVRALGEKEQELYRQIAHAQQKLVVQFDSESVGATRDGSAGNSRAVSLRALKALTAEHERIAQELRLARTSFAGVPVLDPFSLETFRAAARKRWDDAWLALDYFFAKNRLYIVSVDNTQVHLDVRAWGWQEKHLLEQATHLHPDMRELIFNSTLHGQRVTRRENVLAQLGELLLPPHVHELAMKDGHQATPRLLIAPHQLLHQLPFQALQIHGEYLATRVQVAYAPTLQGYAQLCENADEASCASSDTLLVCGVEKFERGGLYRNDLKELKHTRREVNQIRHHYPTASALWQNRATRAQLLEWNDAGRLREFSILHFATHATLQADAPHLAAIELGKEGLTFLDITNLKLNARLVTLSACSSNIGQGGSGDEWASLARAFFYAGARALVASLWAVDDESTAKLMGLFYKGLARGESIANALAYAQREMIRQGASPLQWAPFVAFGNV